MLDKEDRELIERLANRWFLLKVWDRMPDMWDLLLFLGVALFLGFVALVVIFHALGRPLIP
jgi:hypothetical protein